MEEIIGRLRWATRNGLNATGSPVINVNRIFNLSLLLKRFKLPSNTSSTPEIAECQPVCEDIQLFQEMWLFAYPPLLGLCLLGNILNLLVYADAHMRATSTVRLLTAKAVANVLYMVSVGLGFIKTAWRESPLADQVYWEAQPTTTFLANTFGGCATWITMILTVETFACISFPLRFKEIWTLKLANRMIPIVLLMSFCLHICTPLTRVTSLVDCGNGTRQFRVLTKDSNAFHFYEVTYLWANALLVILVPFVVMSVLSAVIIRNLVGSNRSRFSSLRKCIIRITLLTSLCHLLLECPQLLLLCAAALKGNSNANQQLFKLDCELNLITNFVSLVNAGLPFFLYVSSSSRFLQVLLTQLNLKINSTALNDCESNTLHGRMGTKRHPSQSPVASLEANKSLLLDTDQNGQNLQLVVCSTPLRFHPGRITNSLTPL